MQEDGRLPWKTLSGQTSPASNLGENGHSAGARADVSGRSAASTESDRDRRAVGRMSSIPLHVKGRAEAWEMPREQLVLERQIGTGRDSCVYFCRWRGLYCAAKLFDTAGRGTAEHIEMLNEISAISHLRHPNLVLFLGACTVEDPLLIVTEYMAGGCLEDLMNQKQVEMGRRWRPARKLALAWMLDLARAVCFLHNCSTPVVHRDLKPSNLLLTDEFRLKVSDFGLRKTFRRCSDEGTQAETRSSARRTGSRYLAPEVVLKRSNHDEKVDIYSMGMIFWYMACGEHPLASAGPEVVTVMTAQQGARPDPTVMGASEALARLVESMWEDNPSDRPKANAVVTILTGQDEAADIGDRASLVAKDGSRAVCSCVIV